MFLIFVVEQQTIIMKTIKYKGKRLRLKELVDNILDVYNQSEAEDRFDWYKDANEFAKSLVREDKGITLSKAAGVIASLSPLKSWGENKIIARSFINGGSGKHTKVFKNKARDIIKSDGEPESILEILNGNKISAFYLNILFPENSNIVTIDRHAISIALGRQATDAELRHTANQYEFFVKAYVVAANKVGISPLLMQSTTWVKHRKIKNGEKYSDVPF